MVCMEKNDKETVVFTIGHSTRVLDAFINILQAHSVTMVVDIRNGSTVKAQSSVQQWNIARQPAHLWHRLHAYSWTGLRHTRKDSHNMGWHNSSFRGFADYMQTEEFKKNLEELIRLAQSRQIALMCAEALPWRCHRSLIADALWVRDIGLST